MSSDESEGGEALLDAIEQRQQTLEGLRQRCYEDGALKRGWLGNEYVTKDGRNVMKAVALVDPVVADALQAALQEPVRARMRALVSVLLLAYERNG